MSHSHPERPATDGPLLETRLRGSRWARPEVHGTIGSTNAEAMTDPVPGRVVVADHQSAGRGRMTRTWSAPPGSALAVSAVLPLPADPRRWGWVPLLVGLAAHRALGATGARVGLKWPNDVLARPSDDRPWGKLAGILCATTTHADAPVVVAGVGTNVDLTADELPVPTATSLRLAGGGSPDRAELAAALLTELAVAERAWTAGGAELIAAQDAYRAACVTLGSAVRVERDAGDVVGDAVDIDGEGRIVVDTGGRRHALAVGDVVHVRPQGAA